MPAGAPADDRQCVDPTLSADPRFAAHVLAETAHQLRAWAPAHNADPDPAELAGSPALPGLTLSLRQVSTHAYSDSAPVLSATIPGVDGLPKAPDVADPDYATTEPAWENLANARRGQEAKAAAAATAAATAIARWPLDRRTDSGIYDCLTAIGTNASSGTRLLVSSDLNDNASRVSQTASLNLRGATVLVLQACPQTDETSCDRRLSALRRWVTKHSGRFAGAFRADRIVDAVRTWLRGI